MRIGIRLHDTVPGPLGERLSFVRNQGFCCAHLAMSKVMDGFDMKDAPRKLDDSLAADVRAAFSDHGMECAVLGCYLKLADPDEESRLRTQEIYFAHLRFARRIGALTVGTETPPAPGAVFPDTAPLSEDAFRLFIDSLRPVVRRAEEENVILAVEPVWNHIVSSPERAERMLEEIPSDHLRIILDAVNLLSPDAAPHADEIIADAVSRLGSKVSVLHMKDFIPENGALRACACGTGRMRYDRLLRFARENGLPMTLENTLPANAEQARLFLENLASGG